SACVKTFMTVQKALKCRGCFGSAAIDRDNGYSFAEIIKEGYPYDFVYGEDWRKNPNKGTLPSLQIFN
ncbi:MAG: hypothetical protein Q7R95_06830, partial [bacterium]|nr:hypothetical protein [bacterium]